jgi:hypothetical protein
LQDASAHRGLLTVSVERAAAEGVDGIGRQALCERIASRFAKPRGRGLAIVVECARVLNAGQALAARAVLDIE